jgi:uncharacterized protein YkwD
VNEFRLHRTGAVGAYSANWAVLALVLAHGCARPAGTPPLPAPTARPTAPLAEPDTSAERYVWQTETRSPRAVENAGDELTARCAASDGALARVAARIAGRELRSAPTLEVSELAFALRSEGAPYVWPRLWTLRGPNAASEAGPRLDAWLAGGNEAGQLRCAIAAASDDETQAVAAVAVGALADIEPLPTSVRIGTWLDFRAQLLVAASSVSVLVLGPRGRPERVPASFDGERARARFRADREGMFLVQLLATVEGGPRPVAEALVFAGASPNPTFSGVRAPGEEAAADESTAPAESLLAMLNAARSSEGLPALALDARLTAVAEAHAEAMRRTRRVAHDSGDGSPLDRATAANLSLSALGENVAHASDAAHAHRALWASPSHRSNLLDPRFEAIGIGIARDDDGSIWVCELFAHRR